MPEVLAESYVRQATPPILYIRRPARLGAAGLSDLTALQNYSRSPYVASRNRSQQIHATGVASVSTTVGRNPAEPRPDPLRASPGGGACYRELPRMRLFSTKFVSSVGCADYAFPAICFA